MNKVYSRINWEDEPSINTPISESNLNKMDYALNEVDTRVARLGGYEEEVATNAAEAIAAAAEAVSSATEAAASASQAETEVAKIFGVGTRINNTANLNDIKTPGKYYADANQTITNAPIGGGFAMLIYPAYSVARFAQVVLGLDGSINVRALHYTTPQYVDQWTEWWSSNNRPALTGLTLISSATDYDSITTPGEYYFANTNASRGSHAPRGSSNAAGRLTVEYGMDSSRGHLRQTYRDYNSTNTYTRVYYIPSQGNPAWTHWFQYSMTDLGE